MARRSRGTVAALVVIMTIAIHPASRALALNAPAAANTGVPAIDEPPPRPDNWFAALAKLVPGEAIVAFEAALQVPGARDSLGANLTILIVLTAMVPVMLWSAGRQAKVDVPWQQYLVRPLAFVLYELASDRVLSERLSGLGWIPGVGAIVIALLTALMLSPPGAQRPPT
jgi:hypothetical protein